ncbi:MAG: hypothetical protein ACK5NL_13255 [Vibrio fluvialis]
MKIETIEQLTALLKESALVPDSFPIERAESDVKAIGDSNLGLAIYSRLAAQAIFENKESIEYLEERDRTTVAEWLESGKIEDGKSLELVIRAISNQTKHGWRDASQDDEFEPVFEEYAATFKQGQSTNRVLEGNDAMKDYLSCFHQGAKPNNAAAE